MSNVRTPLRRRHHRAVVGLALLSVLGAACRDPEVTAPTPTDAPGSNEANETPVDAGDIPDPRSAPLAAAGRELLATLRDANTAFEGLARATSMDDARPTVLRVRAVLAADPRWADPNGDGTPDDLGVRPLLPGPANSREETIDYGDAFTAVMTAARDAGAEGAAMIDVLRDPIVSDLGSWQRDPAGMLAGIESAVRGLRDIGEAERVVADLDGEAVKALAWALLAVDAPDLETVQAYGERGAVHVGLMLDAVAPLVEG